MRFCENDGLGAELLRDAFDLSYSAHKGQKDKTDGDYFEHPLRVAAPFLVSGDAEAAIVRFK